MAKPENAGKAFVGIVQTSTYIRVRAEPKLVGAEVAQIVARSVATYYPDTVTRADGWDWVWGSFVIPDGRVFEGWMARVWPLWSEQFFPVLAPGDFFIIDPCDFPHVVTARFNDPRDYPQNPKQKQLHEGLDLAPIAPAAAPYRVLAAQSGTVTKVATNPTGYGLYVRIEHEWGETETYVTWYGHLAAVHVREGDTVVIGQHIGDAGSSGNSSGTHVHLTLQHIGHGLANYVVDDVVNPDMYLSTLPDNPVPVIETPPVVTEPVTPAPTPEPDPAPVVTLPLPELSPDPAVRAQTVALLRWLADVIEAAPGAQLQ